MIKPNTKNKTQHYIYSYEAIPGVFRNQTDKFFECVEEDGVEFFKFWWNRVGDDYPEDIRVPSDGLAYEVRKSPKGGKIILLTLPTPQREGEPYFLALVYPKQKYTLFKWENFCRIFSLSNSKDEVGNIKIGMGEITPRGKYVPVKYDQGKDIDIFYQHVLDEIGD